MTPLSRETIEGGLHTAQTIVGISSSLMYCKTVTKIYELLSNGMCRSQQLSHICWSLRWKIISLPTMIGGRIQGVVLNMKSKEGIIEKSSSADTVVQWWVGDRGHGFRIDEANIQSTTRQEITVERVFQLNRQLGHRESCTPSICGVLEIISFSWTIIFLLEAWYLGCT